MSLSDFEKRFVASASILTLSSMGFFLLRAAATHTTNFWFLLENLALAWLPLLFVWLLGHELKQRRWLSWQCLALSLLWLVFLPNSWYVLTDFVHVQPSGEISLLFDIVLVSNLVFACFTLGFASLYLMHRQLLKRLKPLTAHALVALILLLSSFAIYMGRELRWSTWDIVANPGGLAINISDRLVDPLGHIHSVNITGLFFILLVSLYFAIWQWFKPAKDG
ncbi:DUF1361 domain-containing protein [Candidatus Saccharibacteria bacterium]|nr:DUF1361 domain-containing protein [Candidatus Saccharibacteria bacterium]